MVDSSGDIVNVSHDIRTIIDDDEEETVTQFDDLQKYDIDVQASLIIQWQVEYMKTLNTELSDLTFNGPLEINPDFEAATINATAYNAVKCNGPLKYLII